MRHNYLTIRDKRRRFDDSDIRALNSTSTKDFAIAFVSTIDFRKAIYFNSELLANVEKATIDFRKAICLNSKLLVNVEKATIELLVIIDEDNEILIVEEITIANFLLKEISNKELFDNIIVEVSNRSNKYVVF